MHHCKICDFKSNNPAVMALHSSKAGSVHKVISALRKVNDKQRKKILRMKLSPKLKAKLIEKKMIHSITLSGKEYNVY